MADRGNDTMFKIISNKKGTVKTIMAARYAARYFKAQLLQGHLFSRIPGQPCNIPLPHPQMVKEAVLITFCHFRKYLVLSCAHML